jgi:hypothetical protein
MSERPTPETDAEWMRLQSGHLDTIGLASGMCRFAKGLERKRDEAEQQRDRLAEALADWHNAAKHMAACHPDEAHCGCVTILWKQITDALTQRDSLAEAMHVIVDVSRKNLDKPHPTIERVYAKAFDSVKGGTP